MMGMNSKKYNDEFTRYLKTTLAYATVELQVDSFVGKKESFTPEIEPTIDTILDTTEITRPSLATQIFDFFNILTKKLSKIFNQVMLTSFVHGKKVKVSRV